MLNLLYCELLKLRHSKMISISVLGAVAVPFMLLVEELQTHAEHPEEKILLDQVYANSVLYMLLLANMMVSVAIASYLFSREYAENTWKTILPIPISRTKVLAVNTDESVHTARSSSACFPVFQCTLSAA